MLRNALILAALYSVIGAAQQSAFVIRRATIVAFFPPVSQDELKADDDLTCALADFQFYASKAREPLRKAGIDFHVVYARSFQIRIGKKTVTFRPSDVKVGYYFVLVGKTPRTVYGVATDVDLLQVAREYFGNK